MAEGLEFDISIDASRVAGWSVAPWYSAAGELTGWSWQAYALGRFRSGMAENEAHARLRAKRTLGCMRVLAGGEEPTATSEGEHI